MYRFNSFYQKILFLQRYLGVKQNSSYKKNILHILQYRSSSKAIVVKTVMDTAALCNIFCSAKW